MRSKFGAVPDAVAPPPHHPRFPLIDGMRAIAVLCVVLVHCAEFGGAFSGSLLGRLVAHLNVGVTIFFLISGFLLYRPFVAHRGAGAAAPPVSVYAKRRFLRIYPAYWLVLTILLVVPGLPNVDYGSVWPMYALLHTLPVSPGPRCSQLIGTCGLAQTWSLVAEVTFYAVLPLYAIVLERVTRSLSLRAWVLAQAAVLTGFSAISVLWQFVILSPAPQWVGWSVTGNVLWFALGMGLAVTSAATAGTSRGGQLSRWVSAHCGVLWLAALGGYLALSLWLPPTPFLFGQGRQLVTHVAFGLIALLLLAPAVFSNDTARGPLRIVASPGAAWLGLISYGVFLWHYAVVLKLASINGRPSFWLLLLGTLAISVACAAASYYGLERPAMKLKYKAKAD